MTALHIDFETRSMADLKVVGRHNYVRHPSTDIWCLSWALEDMEPKVVTAWQAQRMESLDVFSHVSDGLPVYAHNAPFELAVWNEVMVPRYGWPPLKPEQVHCTMAMAYAMGLPGALEDAALAMGLSVLKDAEGRALMLRMSRPRRMAACPDCINGVQPKAGGTRTRWACGTCNGSGVRPVWWDDADKLARLYAYCQQDVRVERELHKRLVPLSDYERQVWLADYEINQRGIRVDVPSAKVGVLLAQKTKEECDATIKRITAGAVETATAVAALKDWLAGQGVVADSLAKQAVVDLLAGPLPDKARQVLLLRQESAKASTAKLTPMVARAGADERVRALVQYHGAATGRWAGRGIQVHNLPRDVPKTETVEKILTLVRKGDIRAIDAVYGPPLTVLSSCIRGLFIPAEGKVFVTGDFSNVEGRGVAWFSGEEWKVKAFRDADEGKGPGIYEMAYAKAFAVDPASVKDPSPERQIGKTMELAFGYQGGVGAFRTMGQTLGVKVDDQTADSYKLAWRAAHPRTVGTWKQLQNAAINAVRQPGVEFQAGHPGRHVRFKVAGSFLWCRLPSGRVLCYPYAKLLEGEFGPQLTYMAVPSPDDAKKGRIIHDPRNASNWARVSTYGGSLMENVIQAMCRDLLVHCLMRLRGFAVLHVHDEIVIEVDEAKAEQAREGMQKIMREAPEWAAGFPLFTKCKVMRRYGK